MGKRSWVAGTVGLCLGFVLGGAATYVWLRHMPVDPGQEARESTFPAPSEQDLRASFQELLSQAGVDAEVVQFRRTDWFRVTMRLESVDLGGGKVDVKPLAKPYQNYFATYEAELTFREKGQIRETTALMWSPDNWVQGNGWGFTRQTTASFQKGEQKRVRGRIGYRLEGNEWKLEPEHKIDAGR